jgi:hypothetical protein
MGMMLLVAAAVLLDQSTLDTRTCYAGCVIPPPPPPTLFKLMVIDADAEHNRVKENKSQFICVLVLLF